MKKLLSLLCAGLSLGAFAQNTLTVQVDDGNFLHAGVAVFLYEGAQTTTGVINNPRNYDQFGYTDQGGMIQFTTTSDTVVFGTFDCTGTFYQNNHIFSPAVVPVDTLTYTTCEPLDCDALVRAMPSSAGIMAEAVALRDYNFSNIGLVTHTFEANGSLFGGTSTNNNSASVNIPSSALPSVAQPVFINYYRNDSTCTTAAFDSLWWAGNGGPTINCNASYFVDSVNTVAFQGQVIIQENSTTSAGTIIDYMWDMGDGTTYNTQYPTHTYSPNAASYAVCLTITAVDGSDTCVSTFCDSIQFDSTGAPVFKNGFTVNVIDPATFSVTDQLLESVKLYPNPSRGDARLTWDSSLDVQGVTVYSLSGKQMMSITPESNDVALTSLPNGVYIIRVQTENAVTSQRLIVQ